MQQPHPKPVILYKKAYFLIFISPIIKMLSNFESILPHIQYIPILKNATTTPKTPKEWKIINRITFNTSVFPYEFLSLINFETNEY